MTMLICPLRAGDNNEELRYAMRSWETNLIMPNLLLVTVGSKPSWLNPDHHVPGNRFESMPLNVFGNVMLGAEVAAEEGYSEVIYMNDDFFCLDPTGSVLPVRRDCTLAEQIAKYPGGASTWWPQSLALTASWLSDLGFPHPWSYEVHRPLLASPQGMLSALGQWEMGSHTTVPQWRTVYGVLNGVEAYPVRDAKLGPKSPGVGTPWLSTSDQSWRRYAPSIIKRFQKPSRWEN